MAYAAVISLKYNIQRLTNPTIDPQITESAYEKLEYLGGLLQTLDTKRNQSFDTGAINALDAQIRDAVWKLEDVVESYAFYHSPSPSADHGRPEQQIDSFVQTVEILGSEFKTQLDNPLRGEEDEEAASSMEDFCGNYKPTTIGLSDDQSAKIINELVDPQPGLKTVALIGMAGIGKTHFAREIYQHPVIVEYFDFTAWVRVGQKSREKNVLVDIVSQLERKPRNLYLDKNMLTLSTILKRSWPGSRYLIVLDDIWSEQVCRDLLIWLPINGARRFLLTTRMQEVNRFHNTKTHMMRFLDNEESWDLLWRNVFGDDSFPPQLEKVGKKIAENCEGLPLLILAVADLLRGLEKTEEYWKKVANKKTTTFVDAYDKISKVLFSSYEYLPQHLKTCFLYMGVFPQSCVIPLSKLINLWTVEDFLEPTRSTLGDFSMECMEKLVSNSVVIVCTRSYNHRIKSSKLHSAYWYLCVKEARKNKFFHVLKQLSDGSEDDIERQRRLSVQTNILFGIKEVYDSMTAASTARSLLCTGEGHEYPVPICLNLMLLRLLDALSIRLYEFPEEVVKLLLLRYLALTHNGKVPSSISKLQRLQFLIVRQHHNVKFVRNSMPKKWWDWRGRRSSESSKDSTCLPKEIWDMQQLKHLQIMGRNLPNPTPHAKLPNLVTLYVNAHSCTKAVFKNIPYLKKLGINIELQPGAAETLSCFEHIMSLGRLESLKCVVANPLRSQVDFPPHHLSNFPRGLKKLILNGLGYSWKHMSAIGSLPNLTVLKLRCSAFQGPEWETEVGEFQSLEFLLLEDIDLVEWTIYNDNSFPHRICKDICFPRLHGLYNNDKCFPCLQRLTIRHCFKLMEIPPEIGDIRSLKTMEVDDCSPSVVASAEQIQEKRSSLQVVINSSWKL